MNTSPSKLWDSPLGPEKGTSETRLSDVLWTNSGGLVWREERSGRGILVIRDPLGSPPRDLTQKLSVQAKVGYGGGDFSISGNTACFVSDGRLYLQELSKNSHHPITPACGQAASPTLSPDGRHIVYVYFRKGEDSLGITETQGSSLPLRFAHGSDFYMQPIWHPSGNRIAWVSWNHPNMPWDGSGLFMAEFLPGKTAATGNDQILVAGDPNGSISIFQPAFSPDGRYLSYVSDQEGWFNLWIFDLATGSMEPLVKEPYEYGLPAWTHGLRTHAWTAAGDAIYAIRLREARASLVRVDVERRQVQPVVGDLSSYTAMEQISLSKSGEQVALLASSPCLPRRVVTVSAKGKTLTWSTLNPAPPEKAYLGSANPVHWESQSKVNSGTPGSSCRGLFYPPRNPRHQLTSLPPAIIRIHGGPTSQALAGYRFDIPFLTSRGFAVLELNYRGSSGYGRVYRDSLKGQWGVADVEDTFSAAEFLVSTGRADPHRLVIMGGSAGGFTVLLSLIRYPGLFRAGVCLYGVSDLLSLASETHKFEAHYLDFLVGSLPQEENLYRERSPIGHAHAIRDPLALFQGEADQVVPPSQSDQIATVLKEQKVPHIYVRFPGEGHGWRKDETTETYLRTLQEFLEQYVA